MTAGEHDHRFISISRAATAPWLIAALSFLPSIALAASLPDFYSNGRTWSLAAGGGSRENFQAAPIEYPGGGPLSIGAHPDHPHFGNSSNQAPTLRIGNDTSPLLLPWAAEHIRRGNAEILAGAVPFTPASRCWPAGVPAVLTFGIEPIQFLQSGSEIFLVYQRGQVTRHIRLNQPHSVKPMPSWYGESVGHYQGNTLIVDTIGLSDRSLIDSFRTPHTSELHVVERYRLAEDGASIDVIVQSKIPRHSSPHGHS